MGMRWHSYFLRIWRLYYRNMVLSARIFSGFYMIKDRIVTIRMSDEEHSRLKEYSRKHQQTITETIKEGVNL